MIVVSRAVSRLIVGLIVVVIIVVGGAVAYLAFSPRPPTQASLTFRTDWTNDPGYKTPFVVAQSNGYYTNERLTVNLVRGYGSLDTAKRISTADSELGLVDASAAIQGVASGLNIKIVGGWIPSGFWKIICWASAHVSSPKDLDGKTEPESPGDASGPLATIFDKMQNVALKFVTTSPTGRDQSFLTHQSDCIWAGLADQVIITSKVAASDITTMDPSQYGLQIYNYVIAVNTNYLNQNPDVVKRFLKASYQGMAFLMQNPDQAAQMHVKAMSEFDISTAMTETQLAKSMFTYSPWKQNGLGWIDPSSMSTTMQVAQQTYNIQTVPPANQIYTNDLLPGVPYPS